MKYIRKTKDEYQLLCKCCHKWNYLLSEYTEKEINERLQEYKDNLPMYAYKIVKKRVKI